MDAAAPLLSDVHNEKAVVRGLVMLGEALRRKQDVQRVSNQLLRCASAVARAPTCSLASSVFHSVRELPASSQSPVVLAMLLQRFTEYCRLFQLAARVHIGTGAPFAALVPMLQSARGTREWCAEAHPRS